MNEFACKCCGQLPEGGIDPRLLEVVNKLREKLGEPLIVCRGYRCLLGNFYAEDVVGGYHRKGMAADVYIKSSRYTVWQIKELALACGADTAVAHPQQGVVHVDMRGWRADWE